MFLLVPAYPGCPGSKAVKRSLLLLLLLILSYMMFTVIVCETDIYFCTDDGNAVNTKQYGSGVVFLSFCPIFRILKIFDDSLELLTLAINVNCMD